MRDSSRIFIFILASDNTSKEIIIIIKTKTKTLLILMKSSYPTYHNNKISHITYDARIQHTHTHTNIHVHIDILLLTLSFVSMEAPAFSSNLIVSE